MAHCLVRTLTKATSYAGVAVLLIVVLQSGCKRSEPPEPATRETPAAATAGGPEVAFKSVNGDEVHYAGGETAVALPANFPADVAVYPKATVVMVATGDEETDVMAKTTDPLQKVKEFYNDKLKSDGWGPVTTTDISPIFMFEGTKKGRTLIVLLSTDAEGKTSVKVTVSKEADARKP